MLRESPEQGCKTAPLHTPLANRRPMCGWETKVMKSMCVFLISEEIHRQLLRPLKKQGKTLNCL